MEDFITVSLSSCLLVSLPTQKGIYINNGKKIVIK